MSAHKFAGIPFAFTHPKGGAGYQRDVPKAFKALVGRNRWTGYHPDASYPEIRKWARALAAEHDALCKALAALPEAERAQLARDGGLDQRGTLAVLVGGLQAMANPTGILANPERMAELSGRPVEQMEAVAYRLARPDPGLPSLEAQHARVEAVAVKVLPSTGEFSWQGLYDNWVLKTNPRDTAQHGRTLRFLYKHIGDVDYRHVSGHDVQRFLDALGTVEGLSVAMVGKEKERVSGMYRAAKLQMAGVNPCRLASVNGVHKKAKRRPYTGAEIRHMLAMAVASNFGGKRHKACLWLIRIIAFMGCRISEATQLQCGDVRVESGEQAVWFRSDCAETGKAHDEKHIKTDDGGNAERRVALHPALYDPTHPQYVGESFVEFAKGPVGDFIFGCFEWKDTKRGRSDYMIQSMGPFLRDVCKIDRPNLAPNHSFRHRWMDAASNEDWDLDNRERFTGQGGNVNRGYGDGASLQRIAKRLWNVNPLSDI